MTRMQHLQSVEPERRQRRHSFLCRKATGVREHRESAGPMDKTDRVRQRQPVLLYERDFPVAEVAFERFAEILGKARSDEGASDVWATDGAPGRLAQHGIERDFDAKLVEPFDDPLRARYAHVANRRQPVLNLGQIAEMQPED